MKSCETASAVRLPSDQETTGRTLGEEEIKFLVEAIQSGTLTSTKGKFVRSLEREFAHMLGVKHAYACSSGSAAVHAAVAALDPNPGDEIVTTPITDMGALTPILYQGAIPVFADVDPKTCNVTAATIEACLSDRTKAVIVTHLFGNPCEMDAILKLTAARGIPVIEDCAQAFTAEYHGRPVGTMGTIGCFSLQQGKHITTGEGGLLTTNDDALARRMFLFINKAWGYGDPNPDHYFLSLNYRMSELQGAVGAAQLTKLKAAARNRIHMADRLNALLRDLPGIEVPEVSPGVVHSFWRYCLMVDGNLIKGGAPALGKLLAEEGISCAPRYIQKPAFECEIFQKRRTFGTSQYPFNLARPEALDWNHAKYPGAFTALDKILVIAWNERYTEEHVEYIAGAIGDAAERLGR